MKKNNVLVILSIIVSILLTSCLTKVDLQKKGSLNLTIKWTKVSVENKSINKAIKAGTDNIIVTITKYGNPEITQSRTINHSNESYHSVEFTNLVEGKWILKVSFRTGTSEISAYEDTFDVLSDAPTIVQTSIGGLKKIINTYVPTNYPEMYIIDGAENVEWGYLAVKYEGNVYSDISPDEATVVFLLSDNREFSSFVTYPAYSIVPKGNPAETYINISSSGSGLNKSTKYYWKALVLSDSSGVEQMVESSVFSFTTRLPYLPEKIQAPYSTSVSDGAIDVISGQLSVPTVSTYPVDPSPQLSYVFYVSSSSAFENFTTQPGLVDGYVIGPPVYMFPPNTKYYWKVRAENLEEGYTDSNIFSFTRGIN